jgi:hypothetical protein
MKIEFGNGSSVESIKTTHPPTRSKRGKNFYWYYEDLYKSLKWYQRLYLRLVHLVEKIKQNIG